MSDHSSLVRVRDLVPEYKLHRVRKVCLGCGKEWGGVSLQPQADDAPPQRSYCETCPYPDEKR